VSGGILKTTVLHLQQKYPDLSIEGLIGTYDEALFHLEKNHLRSRMIFFLGSSIGNFTESESNDFLGKVSHALTQGDYFLLGIDLQKPKEILEAAYNDLDVIPIEGAEDVFGILKSKGVKVVLNPDYALEIFSGLDNG
jgi:uncharacterized SAM-dependent methyltransferase